MAECRARSVELISAKIPTAAKNKIAIAMNNIRRSFMLNLNYAFAPVLTSAMFVALKKFNAPPTWDDQFRK
jgi:hypothetical protein